VVAVAVVFGFTCVCHRRLVYVDRRRVSLFVVLRRRRVVVGVGVVGVVVVGVVGVVVGGVVVSSCRRPRSVVGANEVAWLLVTDLFNPAAPPPLLPLVQC
jgi:hypothetical protein